jgi:hypothetical protein
VIRRALGPALVWFTDRHDGTSSARYRDNNLADHVGDDPVRVGDNRRRLAAILAAEEPSVPADPTAWVWLRQVHGTRVVTGDDVVGMAPEADASVTTTHGLPLVALTADCAPIALADDTAVGVVHAGWLGLERGVIEAAVLALRAMGSGPVRAALGPCIHPARYEFGSDLLARLTSRLGAEVAGRTAEGAPALDIPVAVRRSLELVDVDVLDDVDVCTVVSPDHFSYRRDGTTGRQAVVAVLA